MHRVSKQWKIIHSLVHIDAVEIQWRECLHLLEYTTWMLSHRTYLYLSYTSWTRNIIFKIVLSRVARLTSVNRLRNSLDLGGLHLLLFLGRMVVSVLWLQFPGAFVSSLAVVRPNFPHDFLQVGLVIQKRLVEMNRLRLIWYIVVFRHLLHVRWCNLHLAKHITIV